MRWLRRLKALWLHSAKLSEHHALDSKFKERFSTLEREPLFRLKDELFDKLLSFDDDDSQCEALVRKAWHECSQELRRRSRAATPAADIAAVEAFISERHEAALTASKRPKRPKLTVVK